MTDLTERELQTLRNEGHDEAADTIERLTATIAGLRESAEVRVQYHAKELADLQSQCDHAVEQAAKNADDVVRLREEVAGLREDAERFISLAEAMIADDDTQDTILDLLTTANPDPKTVDEVRAAIDAARKTAP